MEAWGPLGGMISLGQPNCLNKLLVHGPLPQSILSFLHCDGSGGVQVQTDAAFSGTRFVSNGSQRLGHDGRLMRQIHQELP